MCNDKTFDWTITVVIVAAVIVFLAGLSAGVYTDIRRSADQETFMSNCVKSHSPTDCAVAYKATK